MPKRQLNLSILYCAIILIALNGLFAKLIPLDAISITQLRSVIAVIGFIVFCLLQKKSIALPNIKQAIGVYFLGVIMGIHWVTFFHSMQISSVAVGMLSLYSFPVITVLIEPWFIRKHPKSADIVAAVIVFIGLFIMVFPNLKNMQGELIQGVLWGVFSALLFSLRNILQKYYFSGISSNNLILHQVIAISIMLILFVDLPTIQLLDTSAWVMLILLGLLCTATAHTLLAYSLKNFAVKTVSLIGCMQPLLATCFAWVVLNEIPQNSVFMGGAIIISVALYESIKNNQN